MGDIGDTIRHLEGEPILKKTVNETGTPFKKHTTKVILIAVETGNATHALTVRRLKDVLMFPHDVLTRFLQ